MKISIKKNQFGGYLFGKPSGEKKLEKSSHPLNYSENERESKPTDNSNIYYKKDLQTLYFSKSSEDNSPEEYTYGNPYSSELNTPKHKENTPKKDYFGFTRLISPSHFIFPE